MNLNDINARIPPTFNDKIPQMVEWRSFDRNENGASLMQIEDIDDDSFRELYSDGTVYIKYYNEENEDGTFKAKLVGIVNIDVLSKAAKVWEKDHGFFDIDKLLK